MKKVFFSLLILSLVCACGKNVTVKGTIAEGETFPEGQLVYLVDGNTVLDSAAVVDGKFVLKAPADPQKMYGVIADFRNRSPRDRSWAYALIPEKGTCNVTLAPKMDDCTVEGSPLSKAYYDLDNKIEEAYGVYREKAEALADDAEEEIEKLYDEFMGKIKDLSLDAIKKNADNYIAKSAINNIIYDLSLDELKDIVAKSKFLGADKQVASIISSKEAALATEAGSAFVDFAGKTPEGDDVKLSDYVGKGKWVLTDFWASWCGPCMGEIPNVKHIYETYEGDNFMVLGVAVWDGDNTDSAARMEEKEMKWHQIFVGDDKTPTDSYGILGIPEMILFAPDGTIYKRGSELRGEGMEKNVKEALGLE